MRLNKKQKQLEEKVDIQVEDLCRSVDMHDITFFLREKAINCILLCCSGVADCTCTFQIYISKALQHNSSATHLHLSHNKSITNTEVVALGEILRVNNLWFRSEYQGQLGSRR